MRKLEIVLIIVLIAFLVVGSAIGVQTYQLIKDIKQDVALDQLQLEIAFTILNQTMGEQRAYLKQEQDLLNSKEVTTSLALGLRTLRNLDKSSIGLAQTLANVQSLTEQLGNKLPKTVDLLDAGIVESFHQFSTIQPQILKNLVSLDQQISNTGEVVRVQLSQISPVLSSTNLTVQGLNDLVRNPSINNLLSESAGTMTELHGTAANLRTLTKPENMYLQAAVALFKFTGLKWLSGHFGL